MNIIDSDVNGIALFCGPMVCGYYRMIEDVLRSKRLGETNCFWKNYTSARNSHNCLYKKSMGTVKPLIYL